MKKTKCIILLVLAVICAVNLNAESRAIGCEITCNTNYTPDSSNVLNFDINVTGSGWDHADFVELRFPQGMLPTSATPLGNESANISGRKIMWGQMAGWTGSGNGTIIGNYNVSVSVTVDRKSVV